MITVGLTGGIGSGKTTVSKMFAELGVPVYIADVEAKALMNRSKVIRRKLIEAFGKQAYIENKVNRTHLAKVVFNDKTALSTINSIVHPKVATHYKRWLKKQDSAYIIKEAAIIFEHNKQDEYDYVITVVADSDTRIERLLERDNTTRDSIKKIMDNQLSDAEKIKQSDFVIENYKLSDTKKQVNKIHSILLETCAST